jgi:hypothetical protein
VTAPKPKEDKFLKLLEDGVKSVLEKADATAAEKLKAIEAGVKVAMIRHRIEGGGGGGTDGQFFAAND